MTDSRPFRRSALVVGFAFLLQAVCVGSVVAHTSEAEQVLEQFERALNAYDEDGVASVFAPDGTVRNASAPNDVIPAAQLRGWARRARERNQHVHLGSYSPSDGKTRFTIEVGEGEWHRNGGTPERASGTAEVRGGRIVTLVIDPAASAVPNATPTARPSTAGVPLAPAGLAATVLAVLVVGLRRLPRRSSHVDGRTSGGMLHSALATWTVERRLAAVAHNVDLPLRPTLSAGQPNRSIDVRQRVEG
jgi:hypothetical protein